MFSVILTMARHQVTNTKAERKGENGEEAEESREDEKVQARDACQG